MQKIKTLAFLMGGLFLFSNLNAQQEMDEVSYSLGLLMAQNFKSQGFDEIDEKSFNAGIHDILAGNEPMLC